MSRTPLHALPYGLCVLAVYAPQAEEGRRDNACIINTAVQVASEPVRLAVSVSQQTLTHEILQVTGMATLSVISQRADYALFQRFGLQSGRQIDKFAAYAGYLRGQAGICYVTEGTNAVLTLRVTDRLPLGSHTLFVTEVTESLWLDEVTPSLTYAEYLTRIKPPPAPAPASGRTVYRCTVCGYEYEGETLPPGFLCPLCGHPASDFERISPTRPGQ